MHVGSKLFAILLCLGLIGSFALVAPATSSAEGARYAWQSSAAIERAGLPRVFSFDAVTPEGSGALLRDWRIVRFIKELPIEPVSIGPQPRMPYERDPAMGLVFVYRFQL